MSNAKRARACDNCHAIKIKCELGSGAGPGPCQRCVRLDKKCTITPPKRQKDRVAELEAQVEALTKLLESQKIQSFAVNDIDPQINRQAGESIPTQFPAYTVQENTSQAVPSKKRRIEEDFYNAVAPDNGISDVPSFGMDTIVSKSTQAHLFEKYRNELAANFPFVPLPNDCQYSKLRETKPMLLQAILYAASPGELSADTQEEMSKINMNLFASAAIAEGRKTIELIQAIQVAVLWYRAPKHHTHVAAYQLIQLAAGISEDIGIGGPHCTPSMGYPNGSENIDTADGWRTWLGSKLLTSVIGIFGRRSPVPIWDDHDEHCIQMLSYAHHILPSDGLTCQYVRAERLCNRISSQLNYYNFSTVGDVSEPLTQSTMLGLRNLVMDWKAQIPNSLQGPTLAFFECAAMLYLHETVLHTPTNKQSFAAPYIAERLSMTDFPAPHVTQEHIASMLAIRNTAHALLDLYLRFDSEMLIALPAIFFAGRAAYAQYILVKLYIATTATGNTMGAFMDPESLLIDSYLQKAMRLASMIGRVDEKCGSARISSAVSRLQDWFQNYNTMRIGMVAEPCFSDSDVTSAPSFVSEFPADSVLLEWNDSVMHNDTFDFGLAELFADPELSEWFPT